MDRGGVLEWKFVSFILVDLALKIPNITLVLITVLLLDLFSVARAGR